jgi:hypothetical protein
VIYGRDQQTLIPPGPDLDALLVSLGPFYACAWCALERSTSISAPVAADTAVAQRLLLFLQTAGVLAETGSSNGPTKRSLYDPISWSYRESSQLPDDLSTSLAHALRAWRPSLGAQDRQWLWRQLADREAAAYLASLLRKHRIGIQHVEEILCVQERDWRELSLGRKRYVLWSSVRGAASEFLSTGGDESAALTVLSREMRSRANWLSRKQASGTLSKSDYCFLPDPAWRRPLMVDVALECLLTIGDDYWLAPPILVARQEGPGLRSRLLRRTQT